jgi:hypothetical protein
MKLDIFSILNLIPQIEMDIGSMDYQKSSYDKWNF